MIKKKTMRSLSKTNLIEGTVCDLTDSIRRKARQGGAKTAWLINRLRALPATKCFKTTYDAKLLNNCRVRLQRDFDLYLRRVPTDNNEVLLWLAKEPAYQRRKKRAK